MSLDCARCGSKEAIEHFMRDYKEESKKLVLFTGKGCDCKINPPVCPNCYSKYHLVKFYCSVCGKSGVSMVVNKTTRSSSYMPESMKAILMAYMLSKVETSRSKLIACFGKSIFQSSDWKNLSQFYSELDTHFLPEMFGIWLQINAARHVHSHYGLSVGYLMGSSPNFKKCKKSDYMQNVIKMFHHFSFMMTCSKRMFNMSQKLDEKMLSVYGKYDNKFSSMISKTVLSKLLHSEIDFIKSLM